MASASPPNSDIARRSRHFAFVPETGMRRLCALNWRRRPATVQNWRLWPVGSHAEGEPSGFRRRKPIRSIVPIRRGLNIDRQGPVCAGLEVFVLRPDRIAVDPVRFEKLVIVVERQRPEAVARRRVIGRECDDVAIGTFETRAASVEVLIEIFRLARRVNEGVRFGDCRGGKVIAKAIPKNGALLIVQFFGQFWRDPELSTCALLGLYRRSRRRYLSAWF